MIIINAYFQAQNTPYNNTPYVYINWNTLLSLMKYESVNMFIYIYTNAILYILVLSLTYACQFSSLYSHSADGLMIQSVGHRSYGSAWSGRLKDLRSVLILTVFFSYIMQENYAIRQPSHRQLGESSIMPE